MAAGPYHFPLHANDWLSSKKVTLMSPAEEGAYIRLLCHAWADPDCALPDDDDKLARLSRLGSDWKAASTTLRACFIPHPTKVGLLINQRLSQERVKVKKWMEKSRLGGINSGKSRHSLMKAGLDMVQTKLKPKANTPKTNPNTNTRRKNSEEKSVYPHRIGDYGEAGFSQVGEAIKTMLPVIPTPQVLETEPDLIVQPEQG